MTQARASVPRLPIADSLPSIRWFAPYCSVVERDEMKQVFVGGILVGQFDPDDRDRGPRNVYAVTFAKLPRVHLGELATALGIGEEYLRRLRRLEEAQGLGAVLKSAVGGQWRITDDKRIELHALFAADATVSEATRRQKRGKDRVSRATISREWHRWAANRDASKLAAPVTAAIAAVSGEQLALFPSTSASAVAANEQVPSGAIQRRRATTELWRRSRPTKSLSTRRRARRSNSDRAQ